MRMLCVAMSLMLPLAGCTPRIEVAASEAPITINMNVKIDHEIRITADKEAAQLLEKTDGAPQAESR